MNKLKGQIKGITSSDTMSLVSIDVKGDIFTSVILEGKKIQLNYHVDDDVYIVFKEIEVGIAKYLSGQISFRNRFKAKIVAIEQGTILSKITLNYKDKVIESIISTQSTQSMKLHPGDIIEWLVKSNEVSLGSGY